MVKEIDMRGKKCPATLLIALRELNNNKVAIKSGELKLAFLANNLDATITIPEAAAAMGYQTSIIETGTYFRIEVVARTR